MRKAYKNTGFVFGENNEFIGISLGYDYCAEHEWGIEGIKRRFGIPKEITKNNIGIKQRAITKFEDDLVYFFEFDDKVGKKKQKFFLLMSCQWWLNKNKSFPKDLPYDLKSYKWDIEDKKIVCAWDRDSFGIIVTKEHEAELRKIYESFKTKDICIGLFGGGAFQNAHLTISIKSMLPKETVSLMEKSDKSHLDLIKIAKKLSLEEKARAKRKDDPFIHISLSWIDYENPEKKEEKKKELHTKYDVQAWVNGSGNNYGWFTVEEVLKWINGTEKKVADVRRIHS